MRHTTRNQGRGFRPFPLRVAALGLLLPLGACSVDKILEVDDPDVATPGSVAGREALPAVYAGALADFAHAYAGGGDTGGGSRNEGQILLSGLLGDEFQSTDTFNTRIEIDQRDITPASTPGSSANGQLSDAERNLHRARRAAENGTDLFKENGLPTDPRRAELFALAGYTYIFFAENYCAGVTFSSIPFTGGDPTFGSPQSTNEVLATAIARFDSALAIAPAGSSQARLATIGKARALLDQGNRAAAAALVAAVPTTFSYDVPYSDNTSRQENGVYNYTTDARRYGVSDVEGGEGLPYRSANDPRVEYEDGGDPFDTNFPDPVFWNQLKYPARDSDVTLANGIEARLIEAEALLNGGASAAYLPVLNTLRATISLPALADPGTATGRIQQFFQERAFWLWLTSHRLGDMRREIRQYGLTEAQVFPSGDYIRGGTYGTDKNLPIFVDEGNNPNFTGCTSRAA
ncbi:hypothetical protein [Longimicrobium sp.]|uniref:hypothetical protein n=1 Tax=Longimicrobium sp. TaxID=2029185 RepID=UPI002C20E8C5|nr:hypothetical protein [Longimicrobium sp.]HSU17683.1 hypothetical protein [Longimicrobium sp.]